MSYKPVNKRPFEATKAKKPKRRQKRDENEEYDDPDESKPRPRPAENKKLVFDDEGNTIEAAPRSHGKGRGARHQPDGQLDVNTKWFQVVSCLED